MSTEREFTPEDATEFFEFLRTGKNPKGVHGKEHPKMSKVTAFGIMSVLQVKYRLIPDDYEMCCKCGDWFDYNDGGTNHKEKDYCDDCALEYDIWEKKAKEQGM